MPKNGPIKSARVKTKLRPDPSSLPFAHTFFFQLANTSDQTIERFMGLCKEYLADHEGQTHFSIGTRVLDIKRSVSALNFEVAIHMVFENRAAYDLYSKHPRHDKFITQAAGMSGFRIVYDWHINESRPQV